MVSLYKFFANCQSGPGALVFAFAVKPEERFEDFFPGVIIQADSIIFNPDFPKTIISFLAGYADHRRLCLVEFETICDQV